MRSSANIYSTLQKIMPYSSHRQYYASQMVIRKEKNKFYMAAYIFFFTYQDLLTGKVNRPSFWMLIDIITGEIIAIRNTKNMEFSNNPYDVKYNIKSKGLSDTTKSYYEKAFSILDLVRKEIIAENKFDEIKYQSYMDMILKNTPEEYRKFYIDLSMV